MAASLAEPVTIGENFALRRGRVWVGQYQYTTPWMYPTGCFSVDNENFTRIENNDIVSCKQRCGHSDIMLQIHKCLCVNTAPDIDARKPRSYCNVRCPGNPSEICGGSDVYLHYTT
ncbi:putative tyrosine-protein kinase Wsck, partial [Mizuhopecten yessoensis]|uniref:putative tyrosine-protein kinase Wsck n=1 Tax=Mizuhopecten yessoensis TaxID=6573 RepID=UPI000B45F085